MENLETTARADGAADEAVQLEPEMEKRRKELSLMPEGFVDVRNPRKWTGTSRPAYIWPEVWQMLSEVRKQKAIEWMNERLKEKGEMLSLPKVKTIEQLDELIPPVRKRGAKKVSKVEATRDRRRSQKVGQGRQNQ